MYEAGLGAPARQLGPYPSFGLGAPAASPITFRGDKLWPGQNLAPYWGLQSKNGRVKVIFQPDGNCVLYGDGQPLWWTGVRPGATLATMQKDGNFVLYKPDEGAVWASDTAGHPGAYLAAQDDGNLVIYWRVGGSALWSSETSGFRYYGGPGEPISFDDVLAVAGEILAVAQVVISFVPGIGQGINAAIAAGGALARGENITDAIAEGVKNALPGGPLAAKAFDVALATGKAIANGEPIGDVALAATRAALPSEEAKKAFDVGLAVVQGQNLQRALVAATAALAPAAQDAAAKIFKEPALLKLPVAELAKMLNTDPATAQTAAAAIRSNPALSEQPATAKRPPPVLKEPPPFALNPKLVSNLVAVARAYPKFNDAEVLYTAVLGNDVLSRNANRASPKLLSNIVAFARAYPQFKDAEVLYVASIPQPKKKPPVLKAPPPKVVATTKPKYGPYPKMTGALSGPLDAPRPHGGGGGHGGHHHGGHMRPSGVVVRSGPGWWYDVPWRPTTEIVTRTETCRTWGNPIAMPPEMVTAAKTALNVSKGQPTTVRGPDGVLYLFSIENGATVARACTAIAAA